MSEPVTETGRFFWRSHGTETAVPIPLVGGILKIEAEAIALGAKQERERLREKALDGLCSCGDESLHEGERRLFDWLLADPEDDR